MVGLQTTINRGYISFGRCADFFKPGGVKSNSSTKCSLDGDADMPPLIEREYVRVKDAVIIFGLGRSTIYRLVRAGRVASVSLQLEGAKRGTRLISVKSMRNLLESLCQGGELDV